MRDVFCEILLRDIEYLLDRYLLKTRKVRLCVDSRADLHCPDTDNTPNVYEYESAFLQSYSRMYWDQDQGSESNS